MDYETLQKKAEFFKEKVRPVHISKKDYMFHNGIILEVSSDFLIIEDEKLGELPIFFEEIKYIAPREPKRRVE